jgi:ABC-type nickel/cobalt efflux system permease component RcnA
MANAHGTLELIATEIEAHDRKHPNHGVGCACHDEHANKIRRLIRAMPQKSRDNLFVVLGYVTRNRASHNL